MRISKLIVFFLAFCSLSYAEDRGKRYSSYIGTQDFCIKFSDESGDVVNDRCKPVKVTDGILSDEGDYFLLQAGVVGTSGATTATTTDTAISTSYSFIDKKISSDPAFQNGTLANGRVGQILTIRIITIDGTGTFTLTPTTSTGFETLVFEAVDDLVSLLFINDTTGWIVLSNESVRMTH